MIAIDLPNKNNQDARTWEAALKSPGVWLYINFLTYAFCVLSCVRHKPQPIRRFDYE